MTRGKNNSFSVSPRPHRSIVDWKNEFFSLVCSISFFPVFSSNFFFIYVNWIHKREEKWVCVEKRRVVSFHWFNSTFQTAPHVLYEETLLETLKVSLKMLKNIFSWLFFLSLKVATLRENFWFFYSNVREENVGKFSHTNTLK